MEIFYDAGQGKLEGDIEPCDPLDFSFDFQSEGSIKNISINSSTAELKENREKGSEQSLMSIKFQKALAQESQVIFGLDFF